MRTLRLLLIALASGWMSLLADDVRPKLAKAAATASNVEPARRAYGQLPLLFEANRGQTDKRVNYVARGGGYAVFLRPTEAVLRLQGADETAALRLQLVGARETAQAREIVRSQTAITYLRGQSRQLVESFERVAFQQVWPGIDVVYHGAQRQLEYDFELRAGAQPERIKLQLDGLCAPPTLTPAGELVLNVSGREVHWRKPVAWQTIDGTRCEVACEYQLESPQRFSFKLGDYDRRRPLVIDPALVYSTFLGGTATETATAIAVDAAGNAYVCGTTTSLNYPAVNALRTSKETANTSDAFVAKLNAAGTALIYSTYLGGSNADTGNTIAVDASGSAYVAGFTASADFPSTAGALQTTLKGSGDGFVVKLNPQGSALTFATLLGGGNLDAINGLALDGGNNVYLTGQTESFDFPTAGATTSKSGTALFKSTNNGQQWNASANGLTAASLTALAQDPLTATTLYGISNQGLYKSTDSGATWSFVSAPPIIQNTRPAVLSFAVDPKTPATIYLGSSIGIFKSTNGGQTFQFLTAVPPLNVNALLIDPQTTTTIYAATISGIYKTTNGGDAWGNSTASVGVSALARKLVIDPTNPAILYAATNRGILKTADRGGSWGFVNTGFSGTPDILALEIDPAAPNRLYAYHNFTAGVVYQTTNGGTNWQTSTGFLQAQFNGLTFRTNCFGFAINGSRVLAATLLGVFLSTDGGNTWTLNEQGLPLNAVSGFLQDRTNPAVVYSAITSGADAFVAKLNATGTALSYSRYLGGESPEIGRSVAVDASGNAWLTGQTASANFPTVNPTQTRYGFMTDIFVTKVNASGAALSFSTYHGGTLGELGYGIALDGAGNAYVSGWTQSTDFPVVNALIASAPGGFNAVVARYKADGSTVDYSTYLGGSRNDQAFAIAVDAAGNALIAGTTASPDFPSVGAIQAYNNSNSVGHAFLTRLSPDGRRVGFSTFLGGSIYDQANGIALDAQGNTYVAGTTQSQDFPVVNPLQGLSGSSDAFIAKLSPSADLALTMAAAPAPVALNNNLTYTLRVTNNGELNATDVRLNDVLPSGATFVSATASQGACTGTATVNCNLGNLNAGVTATVTMVIQPPARLKISNTASVTANEPDGNATNNSATLESDVIFYDLAVTLTVANDRVTADGQVIYFASVTNRKGVAVDNVTLNFALPTGLTFVSCNPEFGVCGGAGNNRVVTIARLESGQSRSATFTARVPTVVSAGVVYTANANVEPTIADANRMNNSASARVNVESSPLRARANGKILYRLHYNDPNDTRSGFYEINPDGSQARRVTELGYSMTWSPNGDLVAYLVNENSPGSPTTTSVYVSTLDGANKRRIGTQASDNFTRLSWSPDGAKVLFSSLSDAFNSRTLSVALADGSGQHLIPNAPLGISDPDWSPDGARIAFVRDGQIWTMRLDGTELKLVAAQRLRSDAYSRPRWSPDATKILFTKTTSNQQHAMLVNADGTGLTRAFNVPASHFAAWSPDGSKIAYGTYGPLYRINYNGSNPTAISPTENVQTLTPEWQPLPINGTPQSLPNTQTFTIGGRIPNPYYAINEIPHEWLLRLSGSATGVIRNGDSAQEQQAEYEAVRLPRGGNFTLTPESLNYRFEPTSRTYTNLTSDISNADFKSFFRFISLSGRITDKDGLPIAGVSFLDTTARPAESETDENGQYAFTKLFAGQYQRYIPVGLGTNAPYEPAQAEFRPLMTSQVVNFVGQRGAFNVGCRVTDDLGRGIAETTVTLTRTGVTRTTTTDQNGNCQFSNVTAGFAYTFKANKTGATFAPAEYKVIVNRELNLPFYTGATSAAAAVSAASYRATDITLNSIVALFGTNLTETTQAAKTASLPTELAGVTVTASGRDYHRQCGLFYASPQQINLLLPSLDNVFLAQPKELVLTVMQGNRVTGIVPIQVRSFGPALFSASATGQGLAAAVALRVKADGSQVYESIARFDATLNRLVAIPLDVSNPIERVFLVLFGTGIGYRPFFRTDVLVSVANQACEVFYAGQQGSLAGLDQVNILLPSTLAGRGEADIALTTPEGGAANVVKVNLK